MKNPSHMEMAIWGLLSLLATVCLVRFADWPFGIVGFLSFLPIAAARATGTYHQIALHYFILALSIFILGGLGIAFFPIDNRVLTPVTLKMLPTLYAGANPAGTDDRTVLFIAALGTPCSAPARSSSPSRKTNRCRTSFAPSSRSLF